MPSDRHFLGWDQPALRSAADWLIRHYATATGVDLSNLLIVVPIARAGRRLRELLAEGSTGKPLIPPSIITPGDLPEHLYLPPTPVAGDLHVTLAMLHALMKSPTDDLLPVIPHPPESGDLNAWLALAREINSLRDDLAREALEFSDVAPCIEQKLPDFHDHDRWHALAQIEARYRQTLASLGLMDRHDARRAALASQACALSRSVVLLAVTDLPGIARSMLSQLQSAITVLLHAPESRADYYDDLGCLVVDRWVEGDIEIDEDHVHVVDRPRDQAHQVLSCIEKEVFATRPHAPGVDSITIGLADATLGPVVARALELSGIPARQSTGKPLNRTSPVMFLETWADFVETRRFDALSALLRHPDVEHFLDHSLPPDQAQQGRMAWQSLMDRYLSDHLQGRLTMTWLGDPKVVAPLQAVAQAMLSLAEEASDVPQPLPHWSQRIAQALTRLYEARDLDRAVDGDVPLIHALSQLGDALREQASLEASARFVPSLTLAQAIRFTLSRLSGAQVPPAGGPPAVELMGWLELPLDDAPLLIITGINEGFAPESVNCDAFLPDHARQLLGLLDNRKRLARDSAALMAMLASRPATHLITGRRGSQDDPLIPSRLLLRCKSETLAQRIHRFYGEDAAVPASPRLLQPGRDRFVFPMPDPRLSVHEPLSVTAFAEYLKCPYRFYLHHVLGLKAIGDPPVEMDAPTFGQVAHHVLQTLATSGLHTSTEPDKIRHYLWKQLEVHAREAFGSDPSAAIQIQLIQLQERLHHFAIWQAEEAVQGWVMQPQMIEKKLLGKLVVDGEPFTITGRIDRVDLNANTNKVRLLDYKTADGGEKPDEKHLCAGQWVNLQLPLYGVLMASENIRDPELGYVVLPKKTSDTGALMAEWNPEQLAAAISTAHDVVRKLRQKIFWPPSDPIGDDLASLCMDEALDRAERIARSTRGRGGRS